jgi:hypothetical protein
MGIVVPANAISAVSTARPRSEQRIWSIPSWRRRSPRLRACSRPRDDSAPSFHPVAIPASLSVLVE